MCTLLAEATKQRATSRGSQLEGIANVIQRAASKHSKKQSEDEHLWQAVAAASTAMLQENKSPTTYANIIRIDRIVRERWTRLAKKDEAAARKSMSEYFKRISKFPFYANIQVSILCSLEHRDPIFDIESRFSMFFNRSLLPYTIQDSTFMSSGRYRSRIQDFSSN